MTAISYEGYQPKHLSFSTVNTYRMCGMMMRLQKVEQREQRPGLAGIGGNAVHTATEVYDKYVRSGETDFDPKFEFECAWNDEVQKRSEQSPSFRYPEDFIATGRAGKEYGGKRGVEWWMDNGPLMVQRWIDWRENGWTIWETPEGKPAIEVELNIVLPGDIPVKMFIDRIMVTPAGQITVVDIKSGARAPETPEQLGLYAVGMEQTFGPMFRPDWGYWWDANKGTHSSPLPLGMYTADYFGSVYREAVAGINAGCFMAKPANSCFNWCSVARFCPANPDFLSLNS